VAWEDKAKQATSTMDVTAAWYRVQAAECAQRAENTTDQQIKAINKEMAASWLRLAELVEKLEADRQKK
jgi:hypothetical protein